MRPVKFTFKNEEIAEGFYEVIEELKEDLEEDPDLATLTETEEEIHIHILKLEKNGS